MTLSNIITIKSGHFDCVPVQFTQSLLDAGLYEDVEGRMFKKRWSNPGKEMLDTQLHFFSVGYRGDTPVGVAYGATDKEYNVYQFPSTESKYALSNGTLGVYVNPDNRGLGLAHDLTTNVLNLMKEVRQENSVSRMALNARRFCAYMVNQTEFAKDFITADELYELVCGDPA